MTTKVVKGIHIRGFYAVTILGGFLNRLFALPAKLAEMKLVPISKDVTSFLDSAGIWIFFVIIGLFAVWVLREFFSNIGALRREA